MLGAPLGEHAIGSRMDRLMDMQTYAQKADHSIENNCQLLQLAAVGTLLMTSFSLLLLLLLTL